MEGLQSKDSDEKRRRIQARPVGHGSLPQPVALVADQSSDVLRDVLLLPSKAVTFTKADG
jgi:hypothetical protein